MLRFNPSHSAAQAQSYFSKSLSKGDYYIDGQELAGEWGGKGAELLGLNGQVQRHEFGLLAQNQHPETGEPLTPRTKSDRLVGWDLNWHAPKGVSLVYGLTQDARILTAFRWAVQATLRDMETEAMTRVRRNGQDSDAVTSNLVWAEFVHTTARPVDGVPDPHLHAHAFVFNATFDGAEDRWKALQIRELRRDAPYYQAAFHARFADALERAGYATVRTDKAWDLAGISRSIIETFSKRTAAVEKEAARRGIQDAETKAELGARTREHKQLDLTIPELQRHWRGQLSPEDRDRLASVINQRVQRGPESLSPDIAVNHAIEHCFARKSVIRERQLAAEALRYGVGRIRVEELNGALDRSKLLRQKDGDRYVTTPQVLAEEAAIIASAREGKGKCVPLGRGRNGRAGAVFRPNTKLNDQQRSALNRILSSRDRVILLSGQAGTGKTTLMREVAAGIKHGGRALHAFAPSAEASRGVLRDAGFGDAETVARLLVDRPLNAQMKNQVIWVDEAGLLGTQNMRQLLSMAERSGARVILSGDSHQHGPVERGDAFRVLQEYGGVEPVELTEILRQKGEYREAVESLSRGETEKGLAKLDHLEWIKEVPDERRYERLAADYLEATEKGSTALVVTPTHAEAVKVTAEIRGQLKATGRLDVADREVTQYVDLGWTEAERRDPARYETGHRVTFHQHVSGVKKGQTLEVVSVGRDVETGKPQIMMGGEGFPPRELPLEHADRYSVAAARPMQIAKGELIRFTRNGQTADKSHRINNGSVYRLDSYTKDGNIRLTNGWEVSKTYGYMAPGYCSTSHASQGKTVDRVLIAQSSMSWDASSAEQLYVSASRGRKQATVYTDDKTALAQAVRRTDQRPAAIEVFRSQANLQALRKHADHVTKLNVYNRLRQARPPIERQRPRTAQMLPRSLGGRR